MLPNAFANIFKGKYPESLALFLNDKMYKVDVRMHGGNQMEIRGHAWNLLIHNNSIVPGFYIQFTVDNDLDVVLFEYNLNGVPNKILYGDGYLINRPKCVMVATSSTRKEQVILVKCC